MLGESHLDTLSARHDLALAYKNAGRLGEALPLFEQALVGLEAVLGAEHPSTVRTREELASAREQAQRGDAAVGL